jgi:hypothetical protein
MIWYYIIFYYSILPTHKRLHSTIGCIFPSVGASRGVLARHGALDASFWRSVPLCRELQLARYKKSLQDGVDGVQRSKDGIWWHMMAWCWGVTSPCLGHSFARGSMQTSMLIPRRPVFLFFSGNLPDMRLKSCNFTEKNRNKHFKTILGIFCAHGITWSHRGLWPVRRWGSCCASHQFGGGWVLVVLLRVSFLCQIGKTAEDEPGQPGQPEWRIMKCFFGAGAPTRTTFSSSGLQARCGLTRAIAEGDQDTEL